MILQYTLNHLRYHWRTTIVTITAISLFIALPHIYLSYSQNLEAHFIEDTLANATVTNFEIVFRDATVPINPDLAVHLQDNFADVLEAIQPTQRTIGVTCGNSTPERFRCFQIGSFTNLEEIVQVVNGALPVVTTPSEDTENSTSPIQAIVMENSAENSNTEIADQITLQVDGSRLSFEISGIVEPTDPDEVFWQLQTNITDGILTLVGIDYRPDIVMLIPEVDFDTLIIPAFPDDGVIYSWRVVIDRNNITADNLSQVADGLSQIEQAFFQANPEGQFDNSLGNLLMRMEDQIETTRIPSQTMIFALMVLLGAHLIALAYLYKFAHKTEWERLQQYGISQRQRLWFYAVYGGFTTAFSLILVPILTIILTRILIMSGIFLDVGTMPQLILNPGIFVLIFGAFTSVVLLVVGYAIDDYLPIDYQTAPNNSSFLTTYYLDIVAFVLGIFLIFRVYLLNTENLSEALQNFVENPRLLIDVIRQQDGLSDPITLFGPIMIMFALSVFSLRIVPLVWHLVGTGVQFTRGIMPQLVLRKLQTSDAMPRLLIILTLSIGFTALILQHTNTIVLRSLSVDQIGGDIRIEYQTNDVDVETSLASIPVGDATIVPVLNLSVDNPNPVTLLGIEPDQFATAYSDYAESITLLTSDFETNLNGLELPDTAETLSMQVNAQTDDENASELQIEITVMDRLGAPVTRVMQTNDPTLSNTFMEYRIALPPTNAPPWRLTELRLRSQRPQDDNFEQFLQIAFIDAITAHTTDGERIIIEDFERTRLEEWEIPELIDRSMVAVRLTTSVYSGDASLRISYEVNGDENLNPPRNIIPINTQRSEPIPVIMSLALADNWASQDNTGNEITVGFQGTRTLPQGFGNLRFNYEVVAIIDDFLTQSANAQYFIVDIDRIRPLLNQSTTLQERFYWNQAWIQTDDRSISSDIETLVSDTGNLRLADDNYIALRENPLSNIFTNMLYGNFWIMLAMTCLVITIYIITRKTRSYNEKLYQTWGMAPRTRRAIAVAQETIPHLLSIFIAIVIASMFAGMLMPFINTIQGNIALISMSSLILPALATIISVGVISYSLSR